MGKFDRTLYMREYKRKQRAAWRAEGRCVICGGEKEKPKRSTCARCSARALEWARRKAAV